MCSFKDFHDACEALFQTARDYTVERIKLYNTIFMLETNSFSAFFARLTAQALCNWHQDQERDTIKYLFIGRVRDVEVQRQLIKARKNLDNTLKLALECEKGASTSAPFQKLLPHNHQQKGIRGGTTFTPIFGQSQSCIKNNASFDSPLEGDESLNFSRPINLQYAN